MSYYVQEVFGVSTEILEPSYVDRGELDAVIQKLLQRDTHIALRGESKCGKSWLRKKNLPDAVVVQCRLNKTVRDVFVEAISNVGFSITSELSSTGTTKTFLNAETAAAIPFLAKVKVRLGLEYTSASQSKSIPVTNGIDDLRIFSEALNASGRRLVIEDFHYLAPAERRIFATDLKALWDYRTYVVIIGIWNENNLLLHLNPDLAGRVEEKSIFWSKTELERVLEKGSNALNIKISNAIRRDLIGDAFGTVGILQKLALSLLDEAGIERAVSGEVKIVENPGHYEAVALSYAEQLNALYQTFANRVVNGIRQRKKATGIYGHMLKVVLESSDAKLMEGLSTDEIYKVAHGREGRIQKPNLRQILRKIDELQLDDGGRGLIISYDENKDEVCVIDKQLFLYRKYATVQWPWERLIEEAAGDDSQFSDIEK